MMEPDSVELLDANKAKVRNHRDENIINLPEYKILTFWDKIDEIGVWNWHSKYPHRQPKYAAPTCQTFWRLKIINHDKAKHCSGYYFFPRNFKKFVKELSILMGVEINID